MFDKYGVILGIFISIVIHAIILFTVRELPGYFDHQEIIKEEYTEMQLIQQPVSLPPPLVEEIVRKKIPEPEIRLEPPAPIPRIVPEIIANDIGNISLEESLSRPDVDLKLPKQHAELDTDDNYTEKLSREIVDKLVERPAKVPLSSKQMMAKLITFKADTIERKKIDAPLRFLPKLVRLEPAPVVEVPKKEELPPSKDAFSIIGPAGRRTVVHRPLKHPEVELEAETEIILKFWVLPNGKVGRVIPIKKGGSDLEAKAIAFIREWRFNPLRKDEVQVEQEGVIPIRFTIR